MKNLFAFLGIGALIVVGCGGGTSTDTDGGGGDGSPPVDGSKPDGSSNDSGASDTGVMDTGVDTGSGNDGGMLMDGGVACTKPGDCGNMFCCATFKTAMGQIPACLQSGTYSTMCTQTCTTVAAFMCNSTNVRRVCDMKSQCNENGYGECCSFMFNNQTISACLSTQEAIGVQQLGGTCL
jgi:hypothetical protein